MKQRNKKAVRLFTFLGISGLIKCILKLLRYYGFITPISAMSAVKEEEVKQLANTLATNIWTKQSAPTLADDAKDIKCALKDKVSVISSLHSLHYLGSHKPPRVKYHKFLIYLHLAHGSQQLMVI